MSSVLVECKTLTQSVSLQFCRLHCWWMNCSVWCIRESFRLGGHLIQPPPSVPNATAHVVNAGIAMLYVIWCQVLKCVFINEIPAVNTSNKKCSKLPEVCRTPTLSTTPTYPLQQRRDQQARKFFKSILRPDSCLHCLPPSPCDKDLIAKL